ncbi:hypothetical protein PIB30_059019 [Stylosanthes scabra]|uniref:Uncharacterized protein n=1 Tax=Stylosanthes scabra TaxID=79078 RepID=A0ABU6QL34_9FABA|nr:hypothetical protein [Stylosanthes scabra]
MKNEIISSNHSPRREDKEDLEEEMSRSALATLRANEEEIQMREMEVRLDKISSIQHYNTKFGLGLL